MTGQPAPSASSDRGRSLSRTLRKRPGLALATIFAMILGTIVAVVTTVGVAAAFANAGNPQGTSHGTATVNPNGTVTVDVGGTWEWPSQTDCTGRYGLGWAVDWWGISSSSSSQSIPGLKYSTFSPPSTLGTGGSDAAAGSIPIGKTGQYFHASSQYNGFQIGLCPNGANGFPVGNWTATATYPNSASVPKQLCVNMYDPHGKQNSASTNSNDYSAINDKDNSIQTNDFNVAQSAYCFAPIFVNPAVPNLNIHKDGPAQGTLNGTGTYTLTVANGAAAGKDTDGTITVTDTLPAGELYQSFSGNNWGCTANGQVVTCTTAGPLDPGTSLPPISVTVKYTQSGTFTDTGYVTPATGETDTSDNTAKFTTTVPAPVTQKLSAFIYDCTNGSQTTTVQPGGKFVVDGSVGVLSTNSSTFGPTELPADTYSVTATPPSGYQLVPCGGPNGDNQSVILPAGTDKTVAFYVVPIPAKPGTPDLQLTKTGPATGTIGGSGSYTITVANAPSPAGADTDATISVTDTLPAGETYVSATGNNWTITHAGNTITATTPGPLAAGASLPPITVHVTYATSGSFTDVATVAPATGETDTANNTAQVTTVVPPAPDLTLVKNGPLTGSLNGSGIYTIDVGDAASAGPDNDKTITVTDTLPAGEAFVSATGSGWTISNAGHLVTATHDGPLAPGANLPTITVKVTYTQTGSLTDVATVKPATGETNTTNNTGQVTTVVAAPDLALVKNGPATGILNGTGGYTISVSDAPNAGDDNDATITVTDTLPAGEMFVSATGGGWTISNAGQVVTATHPGPLAAGSSLPVITVNVTYTQTGSLTDVATVQPATGETNLSNNTGQVTTLVPVAPDLALTKAGPATGTVGGSGSYTITVSNAATAATVTDNTITVTDALPTGEAYASASGTGWTITRSGSTITATHPGPLAAGDSLPVITVNVTYTAPGSQTDVATVTPATGETNLTNNTGQVTTIVPNPAGPQIPDLALIKTGPATGLVNGTGSYNLLAFNVGAGADSDSLVTVTDTLPAGETYVSATGPGWTCSNAAPVITCTTPGPLASGAQLPLITVTVNYTQTGSLIDTGYVTPGTNETNPGNNTSTVTTVVTAPGGPDLSVLKKALEGQVSFGDPLDYTLTVSNVGATATTGSVVLTDTAPTGLTIDSVVPAGTGWTCTVSGQNITCTWGGGPVAPGAILPVVTVHTTVDDSAPPTLTNTGVITTPGDTNPTNNTSTVTTPVVAVLGETFTQPPTVTSVGPSTLPFTGLNAGSLLMDAVLLLLGGGLLFLIARRRRTT